MTDEKTLEPEQTGQQVAPVVQRLLLQLHQRNVKTKELVFVAQKECDSFEDFNAWTTDVMSRHVLPSEDWTWEVITESSLDFMRRSIDGMTRDEVQAELSAKGIDTKEATARVLQAVSEVR